MCSKNSADCALHVDLQWPLWKKLTGVGLCKLGLFGNTTAGTRLAAWLDVQDWWSKLGKLH